VADRAADPERLIGTDRRDVQPLIAFETAGERDADDRCRSDVTEDLIGAKSRSERPCAFIHGLRWERGSDAVERADEISSVESATRNASVQRIPYPE
jgi:hypothetical protein